MFPEARYGICVARRPGAIWQVDHTLLDIRVRDERDRPARHWLTVIVDDYGRAFAGYQVGVTARSELQTALAYLFPPSWLDRELPH